MNPKPRFKFFFSCCLSLQSENKRFDDSIFCVKLFCISEIKNCTSDQFDCGHSVCINGTYQCDGRMDCLDGSDELNCGKVNKCIFFKFCLDNNFYKYYLHKYNNIPTKLFHFFEPIFLSSLQVFFFKQIMLGNLFICLSKRHCFILVFVDVYLIKFEQILKHVCNYFCHYR